MITVLKYLVILVYWLKMASSKGSAVTTKLIRHRRFWIKRDDLLSTSSGLNGNKARKFMHMETMKLPRAIVSYGGHQSNALHALAKLVDYKRRLGAKSKLTYYCRALPKWLKTYPVGSFKNAFDLGTCFVELSDADYDTLAQLESKEASEFLNLSSSTLFVKQGGACELARPGTNDLADEIVSDIERLQVEERELGDVDRPWKVLIASGTGTTAVYLHERLRSTRSDIKVVAVPCVGSGTYLEQQMAKRATDASLPMVLSPVSEHPFGKPRHDLIDIWREIRDPQVDLDFDLVYAPRAFETILANLCGELLKDSNIMYYHCGGIEGNESQFRRYERSGLLLR